MSDVSVAVSGITGFIGSRVAADLLQRGYTVHGTLRRNTPQNLAPLTSLNTPGQLKAFEADLTTPNSFDECLVGCKYAIHVASPYSMNVKDAVKDLIEPAVNGTRNFLQSCTKAGVKKVVLTSSMAAIADGGANGKVFTESDWNHRSSEISLPYYYSKMRAEQAAWKYVRETDTEIKLVVINPVMVIGPSLNATLNASVSLLQQVMTGKLFGILDLQNPVVDVRDVAEAHVRAMESECDQGRYICCADGLLSIAEMTKIGLEAGFSPPTMNLSWPFVSWILKMASYLVPGGQEGIYMRNHVGNPIIATNAKIVKDLGMRFRPIDETVKETLEDMVKWGHLSKRN